MIQLTLFKIKIWNTIFIIFDLLWQNVQFIKLIINIKMLYVLYTRKELNKQYEQSNVHKLVYFNNLRYDKETNRVTIKKLSILNNNSMLHIQTELR